MTAHRVLSGVFFTVLIAALAAGTWWLVTAGSSRGEKSPPPPIPASVAKPLKEDQINAVTLTADAVRRLDLRTGRLERKAVRQQRVYGGEITIPAGQTLLVSAPVSGILKAPPDGIPTPGQQVKRGQVILHLLPLLSPESRVTLAASKIDAESQIKTAQIQLEAAEVALKRATRVFKSEAGSRRAVDEALAQVDLAKRAVEAAIARNEVLEQAFGEGRSGTAPPLMIRAPDTGILRNISALAEQNVPSGAALFEVINLDKVWVRVAVYVGDLSQIATKENALVSELTAAPGATGTQATPIEAPPSANPNSGTVDLFYALENGTTKFSPGQRVGISLTLNGAGESLTVPWSAVIHDIYGGTWIYEHTGKLAYVRRRVVVRYVSGQTAVLASGPSAGTEVVVAGAAELFGAETGFSK